VLQAGKVVELGKKYQLIWKEHVNIMQETQWIARSCAIQYLKGQEADRSVPEYSEHYKSCVALKGTMERISV
jgi:hypothetical protein